VFLVLVCGTELWIDGLKGWFLKVGVCFVVILFENRSGCP